MIEPGQKIAVSDTLRETAKVLNEDRMKAEAAFREASTWMAQNDQGFWRTIREHHPELNDYHFRFNHVLGEITVLRKKTEWEMTNDKLREAVEAKTGAEL